MKNFFLAVSLFFTAHFTASARQDTIQITPSRVNTGALKSGTHRWLVYFKMGKDSSRSRYQFWTRKVEMSQYQGKDAISITQEWENNDTVVHRVYSVCDKKSFAPLYHETWNKGGAVTKFDFISRQAWMNEKPITRLDPDTNNVKRLLAFNQSLDQYVLNWHLDLEVFPLLPYRENTSFAINFYDPGFSAPMIVYYTVSGTAVLKGYDGQDIDCWLLEHTDTTRGHNREVFYVSKKTREVLQLEQQFGSRFRYKVKMAFSN